MFVSTCQFQVDFPKDYTYIGSQQVVGLCHWAAQPDIHFQQAKSPFLFSKQSHLSFSASKFNHAISKRLDTPFLVNAYSFSVCESHVRQCFQSGRALEEGVPVINHCVPAEHATWHVRTASRWLAVYIPQFPANHIRLGQGVVASCWIFHCFTAGFDVPYALECCVLVTVL